MLHLSCWAEARVDPQICDPHKSIAKAERKPELWEVAEGEKQTSTFSRKTFWFFKHYFHKQEGIYIAFWKERLI